MSQLSPPREGERAIEGARRPWGKRESAAERARRMLVGLAVGPSRAAVLTAIGSAALFVTAIVIGYLTR